MTDPRVQTMGGYVTQSREVPGYRGNREWDMISTHRSSGSVSVVQGFPTPDSTATARWRVPRQVTTSYRSGRGEDPDAVLLDSRGSSWAARNQAIRRSTDLRKTEFDNGHEFDSWKQAFVATKTILHSLSHENEGFFTPSGSGTKYPIVNPDLQGLQTLGTYGINRTIPTNSPADLAQALIELKREGLPSLIGMQALSGRSSSRRHAVGSEYLNYEFGLKPLIRDLRDTLEAVTRSSEILKTYQEGSGRKLHRQYTFPTVTTTTETHGQGAIGRWPFSTSYLLFANRGIGDLTETIETRTRTWFNGCYSYYLQDDSDVLNRLHGFARDAEHLLGLELTPELIWEVAPWSWLVDWVSNIGVNISNATALSDDGLVLRYGYIMRETTVHVTRRVSGLIPLYGEGPRDVSSTASVVRKQRMRATPYGFGLNPSSFNARKWAILGALGMTRGNNSLRLSE